MKTVLSIAGSDCSGGAGIQADLKTITCHNMYGMTAVTALTAQNTTGVYGIQESTPEFLSNQLDCIFTDIVPDAVKIGMVSSPLLIQVIIEKLMEYKAQNIVLDPVMVSTSGSRLMNENAYEKLKNGLIPICTMITPNMPEAEVLSGCKINTKEDMKDAAGKIALYYSGSILIKGGHMADTADDLLFHNGNYTFFMAERVQTSNTHGTGCTLSSAVACNLAAGRTPAESVKRAKAYVTGALKAGLKLGKGNGPLMHNYLWTSKIEEE